MFKHKTAYKSKNITRSLITGGRSYFKVGGDSTSDEDDKGCGASV